MDYFVYFVYFVAGLLTGVVSALLGISGGIIILFVLTIFGFNPAMAVGTSLVAIMFSVISGAYEHIKLKNVDVKTAKIVGFTGIVGVIIGSIIFEHLKKEEQLLYLILGVVFILVSLKLFYDALKYSKNLKTQRNLANNSNLKFANKIKGISGIIVGCLSSIIGSGGGFILTPLFTHLKIPVRMAIGTTAVTFLGIVLVGGIIKIYQGVVDIPVAVSLGIGAAIGAIYGAKLVFKFSPKILIILLAIFLFYSSLRYFFVYFGIHI